MKKVAKRSPLAPRLPAARSRITNGAELLAGVDGRSATARRYRDIAGAIIADQGGLDRLSETRVQLIRRFAAASVIAEQMEARLANGEAVDVAEHSLLSSTLVRVAHRIGIDRRSRTVVPNLRDYLEGRATIDDEAEVA
jgi:hypothetical protein